jgi:hypothetical protein
MRLSGVTLGVDIETTGINGKLQFDGGLTLAGATINPGGGNQMIFDGGSQNETSFVQTSGELIINGTAAGNADVEIRGGTLSGSGSLRLNGALNQLLAETGGTISPSNSIDTLQVDGDV